MTDRPVALISGASRGIGAAIARRLSRDGYSLAFTCRGATGALEAVAADCRADGAETLCLSGDCADPAVCQAWIEAAQTRFGRIDVLVNNAGVTRDGLLMRMGDDAFDEVMRVNLYGAFYLCRAVSKWMIKRRFGRILNMSSVVGLAGNAGQCNYAASKAGLIGFTKSLAKELASRSITVNAIAPGFIESDMTAALSAEQREAMTERVSLRRAGKPEEVASLVSFLASEEAAYITGQVIAIDGGLTL